MSKILAKYFFLVLFVITTSGFAQNNQIDSLLKVIDKGKDDTNKVYNLLVLSELYYNENVDTAYAFVEKAKNLALKINEPRHIAMVYGELAWYIAEKGNFIKARNYYLKAFKIDYDRGDKNNAAKHLGNLGIMYKKQGIYTKSLDCYFLTLKLAEQVDNKKFLATVNGNIGNIYNHLQEYDNALRYHKKAVEIDTKLDNKRGVARHYGNMGISYRNKKEYDKALDVLYKALAMDEELGNNNGISLHLSNIGNTYSDLKQYDKALEFYNKGLAIDEKLNYEYGIAFNYANISAVYLNTNQLDKLEGSLKKAYEIGLRLNSSFLLQTIHDIYASFYERKKMFPEAFNHYKQFIAIRDSLQSEENVKASMQKDIQYEYEKKETIAKAEQEKKEAITTEKIRQQKIVIYSIIVGLALLIISIVFISKSYFDKKKSNTQLINKNIEINLQKQLIEEKNSEIIASIRYAKRIQDALMTSQKYIERNMNRLKRG